MDSKYLLCLQGRWRRRGDACRWLDWWTEENVGAEGGELRECEKYRRIASNVLLYQRGVTGIKTRG